MEERLLNEAQVEHDSDKMLIIELQAASPDDQYNPMTSITMPR